MPDQPTILLVHGAWHGSWCWDRLREVLEARGRRIEVVDLPTVHSADPAGVPLAADADAVDAAIERIDGPVIVVAHSYGGIPVTVAATADRVPHIVYVAAFALDAGESLLGAVGGVAPPWWVVDGPLVTAGTADLPATGIFFNDLPDREATEAAARLRPQSLRGFTDELPTAAWRTIPSSYVVTELDAAIPAEAQAGLAARAGSTVHRMPSGHSPFLSRPEALAELIDLVPDASGD